MKCKKCGKRLGPEDAKCRFCGADNPFAVMHEKNMQRYNKRFDETGRRVLDKAGDSKGLGNRAAVIVVLILLIIATGIITSFNYTDHDDASSKTKLATPKENLTRIDELLEQGEYIECVRLMHTQEIINSGDDEYRDMKGLIYIADNYCDCIELMEGIVYLPRGEEERDAVSSYCNNLGIQIDDFYEVYDVWKDGTGSEKYSVYYRDIENELRTAVKVYFEMDDDAYEEFLSLSENQKAVKLEEIINNEK
ncbi:hypothetical protein SAMN02910370_02749 [Lachnospiraceae bacterium XPB1003]|nr:hypothetical protein SAMN02910370_02749 [Lachnospiraceae bacterium XPB1003]